MTFVPPARHLPRARDLAPHAYLLTRRLERAAGFRDPSGNHLRLTQLKAFA